MLKSITIMSDDRKARIGSAADTFSFEPGINLLVGRNGSGKSTIFDLIASGNEGISKGIFTAEVDGIFDLRAMRMEDQARHNDSKIQHGQNIAYYLHSHFVSHGEANWPIVQALRSFEDGTLLLLDEPEQALDMHHMMALRELLVEHAGRLQFIIATHHPVLICMPEAHHVLVDADDGYVEDLLRMYRQVVQ